SSINYTFDAQKVLDDITEYSLAMARKVGYDNGGTWEWIVTRDGRPFLMEVNTRIQVENGVSAMISRVNGKAGVDLIAEQIRVGLGEPLGYSQDNITFDGVGIEYRLIAENPEMKFTPWVGRIEDFGWDKHDWLQMHTHVPTDVAYDIPTEFDPNLALGIIWGKDLAEVKKHGKEFLDELRLSGSNQSGESLKSNVNFLRTKTDIILQF
ncbi:MAG: acetyl-CoA carboxylase biotin carboxylase subunit, partial [Desulfovibrionales bacterium]|nr:acetyl-CoA carboxylase biotin carboxylase subunit [Desulfovibrionales bacterium]